MSETDEAQKLLEACDDMLDLHRRQGTEDGMAARQVATKRREVEKRLTTPDEAEPASKS